MLKDYRLLPQEKPSSLVILLHGVGSNGEDLIGLADVWRGLLPRTAFISPDGAEAYDMAPFGRQWFSLRDWSPESIHAGIKKTAPVLNDYIAGLQKEFDLTTNRVALVGFSQGTMMSLYVGLRYQGTRAVAHTEGVSRANGENNHQLAGILGYSGALFGAELLEAEIRSRPPVCLVHGNQDDVVPVAGSVQAAHVLKSLGCETELHTYDNLAHSINDLGLRSGAAFLQRTLKEA